MLAHSQAVNCTWRHIWMLLVLPANPQPHGELLRRWLTDLASSSLAAGRAGGGSSSPGPSPRPRAGRQLLKSQTASVLTLLNSQDQSSGTTSSMAPPPYDVADIARDMRRSCGYRAIRQRQETVHCVGAAGFISIISAAHACPLEARVMLRQFVLRY
jgi:hypothetical protein